MDLVGLDVNQSVHKSLFEQYLPTASSPEPYLLEQRVAAGLLGRKTGRGWYAYAKDGTTEKIPEQPVPQAKAGPVWVAANAPQLKELLQNLGATVEAGAKPSADAICFAAPLGQDATTTALQLQTDPARTVAVDPLYGFSKRRTLMTTPVTRAEVRDAAHALLASDGVPVSVIHDSPGFVAQRVVAHIVNVGCDIVQQRIATPADLDAAVMLGLGYPRGPLAMGDAVGAAKMLTVLEAMHSFYQDPRYRPSPWLKRRARLGVSLLTPE